MKVVFVECELTMGRDTSVEVGVCPPGTEFVTAFYDHSKEDNSKFFEDIADADIVLSSYKYMGKPEIDALKHCKVISLQATGYNEIDMDYATSKGIAVASILDYCTQETAENAFAMMMALQRGLPTYHRVVQIEKKWDVFVTKLQRIEGQTMGIAGFGRIGQHLGKLAKGAGMNVIAFDPFLPQEVADNLGVKLVDKDTLLAESDVISIHMNFTPENIGFLDMDAFKKMKKNPIIINEGRGPMINEEALIWALDNGVVRGAGLDMLEVSEHPDLSNGHPLLGRENVIVTPHSGYYSEMSDYLLCKLSMENGLLCYQGKHKEAKVVRNGIGLD